MRLIKSNIPTDRKNSFFIKVLSGILVFCLLLVSFVFLLIYQNVKKRSLEQSYLAEQDIVSNVSYSASIMQDTASSMLTQLNGDPKLLQLIYSMDTESLSVIQSMQLLQSKTIRARRHGWTLYTFIVQRKTVSVMPTPMATPISYHLVHWMTFSTQRSFGILQLCPV